MISQTDRIRPARVKTPAPEWKGDLSKYQVAHTGKAVWQLVNTFVPYAALWALMAIMLRRGVPFWWTLPLSLVAAGLLVRIFIFFHDCGHGCFFPNQRANRILGHITGILTLTPFDDWRHEHALHHAGSGNLDRRGAGDIWTMTVEEYRTAPRRKRLAYRLYRHPLVLLLIGPLYLFFIRHRFPHETSGERGRRSVLITNVGGAALAAVLGLTLGWRTYLLVQIPVMGLASIFGVWMFYVQHQYERTYWAQPQEWDPILAAMEGSSYYKLPKVLQWFSGNIGLHHIHHLQSRIPNYNLQACYDSVPAMQRVEPLTFTRSLGCIFLNLWDEDAQNMVSFRAAKSRA